MKSKRLQSFTIIKQVKTTYKRSKNILYERMVVFMIDYIYN